MQSRHPPSGGEPGGGRDDLNSGFVYPYVKFVELCGRGEGGRA